MKKVFYTMSIISVAMFSFGVKMFFSNLYDERLLGAIILSGGAISATIINVVGYYGHEIGDYILDLHPKEDPIETEIANDLEMTQGFLERKEK